MNSLQKASLVFSAIASTSGLARIAIRKHTADFGLNHNIALCLPAIEQLEENFSDLINGFVPMRGGNRPQTFINGVDNSHNSTEGVEFLCDHLEAAFQNLLSQALFTARQLEDKLEDSGDLDLAARVHAQRVDLVKARTAHYTYSPIEG